jgi:YD repeat-containing protein
VTTSSTWFDVDKEGLAALLDRRGRHRIILETASNSFDEPGVTAVDVTLVSGDRGRARFTITDDAPDGFTRLSDAWTMFAASKKKGDVEQRGRFNLGEKLFLAACVSATIRTTTGTVTFDADGRRVSRHRRDRGSELTATLRFNRDHIAAACDLLRQVIVPHGITLTVNHGVVEHRVPVRQFTATLPTEYEDADGQWHSTARQTTVSLYEPVADTAQVYEMGIPVVEIDGMRWDIDIAQKVPLNTDRDNITPGYLRKLRTVVLDATFDLLDPDQATAPWVADALPAATPEAINAVLDQRYGTKRVIADPSDPEGTKIAASRGYTIIHGGALDRETWGRVKEHGLMRPAGQVTPSPKVITSPDGQAPLDRDDWTPGMRTIARFAQDVASEVLGIRLTVDVYRMPIGAYWAAAYAPGHLSLNLTKLSHRWFDTPDPAEVMRLLIHEFAHHYSGDHLSSAYHDALCRIGAKVWSHADALAFPTAVPA